MAFETCPTVCNADLANDLMSSVAIEDATPTIDRTCNSVLFLTDDAGEGFFPVAPTEEDARTRLVTSLADLDPYYRKDSETYNAARDFFSSTGRRGVAAYFTLGYWDGANETALEALDKINECTPCWTYLAMVHKDIQGGSFIDGSKDTVLMALAQWAIANEKLPFFYSHDAAHKTPADSDSLKAKLAAQGLNDVFVIYNTGQCEYLIDPANGSILYFADGAPITDADGQPVTDPETGQQAISDGTTPMSHKRHPYLDFLAAGWMANVDLTQANSGYTLAYKPLNGLGFTGITPANLNNAEVSSVTGGLPDGSLNPNNNGYANVYVKTAGRSGLFPGISVGGAWIDQIHLNLFLKRRLKDELATLFFGSRRLPYDDARGKQQLATAIANVMADAQGAGHFSGDVVNWSDYGVPVRKGTAWVIWQDNFADQTQARKNARLAPALRVCFIPASATHHVPVTLCTLAVPRAVNAGL